MSTVFSDLGTAKMECKRAIEDAEKLLKANGFEALVEADQPIRIAMFGQYNSGKSTLVNALLGRKAAITGDSPETKLAQIYPIQGFQIADLPGGNARLSESVEASAALKTAHVVLYLVSSSTGLDYDTIWADLEILLQRGIPFQIVANDKVPHEDEESELLFRKRVEEHFRDLATVRLPKQDWANRFFWVRAKSAELGRLQGKEGLVLGSGIIPLEHAINAILRESDAVVRALSRLRYLRDRIAEMKVSLEHAAESLPLKGIEDALHQCEVARGRLEASALLVADDTFLPLHDAISMGLQQAIANPANQKAAKEGLTELIRATYQGAFSSFGVRCAAEVSAFAAKVGQDVTSPVSQHGKGPNHDLGAGPGIKGVELDAATILGRIAAGTSAIGTFITSAEKALTKEATQAASKAGAEAVVTQGSVATGKSLAGGTKAGAETAAKEGGKGLGKIIGPVVIIAVAAWEIRNGFKAAEKEREAHDLAVREAEAKAALAAKTLRQQFLAEAMSMISKGMDPLERLLRDELAKHSRTDSDMARKLYQVSALMARMDASAKTLAFGLEAG